MSNTSAVHNSIKSALYGRYCPRCDGKMKSHVKPVDIIGIKLFLDDIFGDDYNELVSLMALPKQLCEFEHGVERVC